MTKPQQNRRDFLKTTGVVATAATFPYWFSTQSARADEKSPNERPIVGCIGTGDRWNAVGPNAMQFGDVVAVCDVDRQHVEKGRNRVQEIQGKKGFDLNVEMYEDYQKLLDRKDIEVVTIVTPDHWHSKIAIDAMRAGKDVYCEKPLTLTIEEGKQIRKVLEETGRVFQVGTQQRSEMGQRFLTAVALVHAGRLGKIEKVQCAIGGAPASGPLEKQKPPEHLNWEKWLGQTPLVEYIPRRCHYEFRWWYEYSGGKMTDWGAHHVDIAQWAIGMEDSGPVKIEPLMEKHPVPFENGYPTLDNQYNAATAFLVRCTFPNGVVMGIRHDQENGVAITGSEGELFVSRGRISGPAYDDLKNNPIPEEVWNKLTKGKKIEGGNAHMANFFDCVKTRDLPISDVFSHHRAMTTCHLANIAIRLKKSIDFNPETEMIENDPEAAKFMAREQRKGYEIDVKV